MTWQRILFEMAPSSFRLETGQRLLWALGHHMDVICDGADMAMLACMSTYAPEDALPYIEQETAIPRGVGESSESYRGRLQGGWRAWAESGTARGITSQLLATGLTPAAVEVPELASWAWPSFVALTSASAELSAWGLPGDGVYLLTASHGAEGAELPDVACQGYAAKQGERQSVAFMVKATDAPAAGTAVVVKLGATGSRSARFAFSAEGSLQVDWASDVQASVYRLANGWWYLKVTGPTEGAAAVDGRFPHPFSIGLTTVSAGGQYWGAASRSLLVASPYSSLGLPGVLVRSGANSDEYAAHGSDWTILDGWVGRDAYDSAGMRVVPADIKAAIRAIFRQFSGGKYSLGSCTFVQGGEVLGNSVSANVNALAVCSEHKTLRFRLDNVPSDIVTVLDDPLVQAVTPTSCTRTYDTAGCSSIIVCTCSFFAGMPATLSVSHGTAVKLSASGSTGYNTYYEVYLVSGLDGVSSVSVTSSTTVAAYNFNMGIGLRGSVSARVAAAKVRSGATHVSSFARDALAVGNAVFLIRDEPGGVLDELLQGKSWESPEGMISFAGKYIGDESTPAITSTSGSGTTFCYFVALEVFYD